MNISDADLQLFHRQLQDEGYLYINGLQPGFDHLSFAQEFGKLLPQYDGRLVWSIKADPQFDDKYHSLNTKKLSPHTECYEYQSLPPKYLALWCNRAPSDAGGMTTLYDGLAFIASLPADEREALKTTAFEFNSSSGIQASALGKTAINRILDSHNDSKPILRFSYNCINWNGNKKCHEIATRLVEAFEDRATAIRWEENAFLIWDNHRMLHSRTAFEDRARELTRVWLSERQTATV